MRLSISTDPQGAELEHSEAASTEPCPVLHEENRARGVEPDRDGDHHENRDQNYGCYDTAHDIGDALDDHSRRFEHRCSELEERLILVPDECGPHTSDLHRARRIQQLASSREARLPDIHDLLVVQM